MKKRYIFLSLILILSLSLVSCSGNDKKDLNIEDKKEVKNEISTTENNINKKIGIRPGYLAYDFELNDFDGNVHKLSDYKGKVVVLNFFASWCGYCKLEMPDLQTLSEEYKDEDLVVIGVDIEPSDTIEKINKLKNETGTQYLLLKDMLQVVANQYYVRGVPTNAIINKDGTIGTYFSGYMSKEDFKEVVDTIYNDPINKDYNNENVIDDENNIENSENTEN